MTNEPPPATAADGSDPSMEEILASIRRILNDDDVPAAGADAPGAPAVDDDVLVLDDSMLVSAQASHAPDPEPAGLPAEANRPPRAVETEMPLRAMETEAPSRAMETETPLRAMEAEASVRGAETAPSADPWDQPVATPNLVAPETAAAAASSVGSLVRTLAADRATRVYGGGPTLEDMVRAELRPLLKDWLDTHLPPMVERLVRTEIERVVGREFP
jgi:cell pole-organizing protein PopZ